MVWAIQAEFDRHGDMARAAEVDDRHRRRHRAQALTHECLGNGRIDGDDRLDARIAVGLLEQVLVDRAKVDTAAGEPDAVWHGPLVVAVACIGLRRHAGSADRQSRMTAQGEAEHTDPTAIDVPPPFGIRGHGREHGRQVGGALPDPGRVDGGRVATGGAGVIWAGDDEAPGGEGRRDPTEALDVAAGAVRDQHQGETACGRRRVPPGSRALEQPIVADEDGHAAGGSRIPDRDIQPRTSALRRRHREAADSDMVGRSGRRHGGNEQGQREN